MILNLKLKYISYIESFSYPLWNNGRFVKRLFIFTYKQNMDPNLKQI